MSDQVLIQRTRRTEQSIRQALVRVFIFLALSILLLSLDVDQVFIQDKSASLSSWQIVHSSALNCDLMRAVVSSISGCVQHTFLSCILNFFKVQFFMVSIFESLILFYERCFIFSD
jgi:hypothetical protein